ncbi:MAG: TadE/TadG family type IV pilus assembly protein [Desulfobaccales bacterium]
MGVPLKPRRLFKLRRGQEGSAVVEFALCLIPLLFILGGIIDFGQAWYMQSMLSTASREGARHATYYYDPSNTGKTTPAANRDVSTFITGKYSTLLPGLKVSVGGASASQTQGDQVSVTVTAPKEWFFLGKLVSSLPAKLSSTTWMALE